MESGQPPHFTWNFDGSRYSRTVCGERLELWQEGGRLRFTPGFKGYVSEFLREGDDLQAIYSRISSDRMMAEAVSHCRGLRITKSGRWESLVCFVCSINNNIPRIRKMVQSLMSEGEVLPPEELLRKDLSRLRLGYRQKFLEGCAERALCGELDAARRMAYGDAFCALQEFPGVGPKVADCVLLFGFGFLEAFPVDVWVSRAMLELYGVKRQKEARAKARALWHPFEGYAQQYLFYAARKKAGRCEKRCGCGTPSLDGRAPL
jgi:N-glycosylase/DNA lyase